jgi:protein-tyrosine phosphatase
MDRSNYQDLSTLCPQGEEHRLHLFMDFAPGRKEQEVPDPYYGGAAGFENVFDLVEEASQGLLEHIRQQHGLQ